MCHAVYRIDGRPLLAAPPPGLYRDRPVCLALPFLLDDAQVIYSAQKNRLGYAGYRRGLRSFGTLAGTLVIKAFDNSQTMTTAMVQRGYDGNMPMLQHKPFRMAEVRSPCIIVCMGLLWKI